MECVRPGARVLVVSRGDDELLRFRNRSGWHFPRGDDGSYAGYHPVSSEDAIEHLKALCEAGARYLLVPAPSFWWRDYYPELFEHLEREATTVCDDDACLIFELERIGVSSDQAPPSALARPLARLLEALLPEGARVAVVSSGNASLLAPARVEAAHFPQGRRGAYAGELDGAGALEQLTDLRRSGTEFLVVPRVAPSWLDGYPGFLEEVEARYRCIARRERICTVYELNGQAGSPAAPDPGDV